MKTRLLKLLLLTALACGALRPTAHAAIHNWVGGNPAGFGPYPWNIPANWMPPSGPQIVPLATDDAVFPALLPAANSQVQLTSAQSINSLTFNMAVAGLFLDGSPALPTLNFGGASSINNNSAIGAGIGRLNLSFPAAATFQLNGPGPGQVYFGGNAVSGQPNLVVNGSFFIISNGPPGLTLNSLVVNPGGSLEIDVSNPVTVNTGPVMVNGGGTLRLCKPSSTPGTFTASSINVAAGGTVYVNAAVYASMNVTGPGTTISAGCSPGTLNLTGNFNLMNNPTLNFELATAGFVGGPNDLIDVTGNVQLNGTLNVTALPGFGQGRFPLVKYSGALTGSGLSFGSMPPGFSYAFDTSTTGRVDLVVSLPAGSFRTDVVPCGAAVATCFSGFANFNCPLPVTAPDPNGPVLVVIDVNNPAGSGATLGQNWSAPKYHGELPSAPTTPTWTLANLGQIFGVTLDNQNPPNIFVTAAGFYHGLPPSGPAGSPCPTSPGFGPGGPGGVYMIDGKTAAISCHATLLPNSGVGLGNICHDPVSGKFFVSSFENGLIYQVPSYPTCGTTPSVFYDHGVTGRPFEGLSVIADNHPPGTATQLGRRVWGVRILGRLLYYSVWNENGGNADTTYYSAALANEIWSVGLTASGNFQTPARREITLPPLTGGYDGGVSANGQYSSPVSDIKFSSDGLEMLLAERTVDGLFPNNAAPPINAHQSRVLKYRLQTGVWTFNQQYHLGDYLNFPPFNGYLSDSCAGGADYAACENLVWATGDALETIQQPPVGTKGPDGYVYGLAGIPTTGNTPTTSRTGSYLVDFDGLFNISKTEIGDVVVRHCCCIPAPQGLGGWWPLDEATGQPIYADLSGSGNPAVVESGPVGSANSPFAVVPKGKVAGANFFVSSTTRGRALDSLSLKLGTGDFSVDCWIKSGNLGPNTWLPVLDKLDGSSLKGYTFGVSNGLVVLRVGDGTPYTYTSANAVGANGWNFIGVAVDRSAGKVRFHVNGVNETPQNLTPLGSIANTIDLLVGGYYTSNPNNITEMALDEVELFNRALATNEMTDLWNAGSAGKCKVLPPCTTGIVSIFCPPGFTVQSCGTTTNLHYPLAVAATSCGTIVSLVCTPPPGSPFPVGPTKVTCTATDSTGSSAMCMFTVTITPDTTPPVIDCPCFTAHAGEVLHVTGCQGTVPNLCQLTICFSDNCCIASCSQMPAAGTVLPYGTHPIKVTITDCAGNSTFCMVNFVIDPPPDGCQDCVPRPSNLVLWLPFDELFGTTAGNYAAGNNGTLFNGPTHTPGSYVANSLCFDGVNDYVEVASHPALGFGMGDFSVDAWVKVANNDNSIRVIVDHRESSINGVIGHALYLWNGNQLSFQLADGPYSDYGSVSVPAGQWHHVAVTVKRNDLAGIKFYYDGTLASTFSSQSHNNSVTPASTVPLRVGELSYTTGLPFNGCIDEVELFNRELAAAEITSIFNARRVGKCKTCDGYPPLVITCPPNQTHVTCSVPVVATYTATATGGGPPVTVTCTPPSGTAFSYGMNVVTCTATDRCGGTTNCSFTVTVRAPVFPEPPCILPPDIRDGTNMVISWRTSAANFHLEAKDSLSPSNVWQLVNVAAQTVNERRIVTLPIDRPTRFFRLSNASTVACGWSDCNTNSPLAGRFEHTAVWAPITGEWIIWGGYNGVTLLNDGARYNPATGIWTPMSTINAPSARYRHAAVMAGTEMIVWGGSGAIPSLNDGARYNPATDTWTPIPTAGAPAVRQFPMVVWSGTEMLVWGGANNSSGLLNTGGRYNPANNTWTPIPTTGAPAGRSSPGAVWASTTGQMVIWGGVNGTGTALNDGARYNPLLNSWVPVTLTAAPSARSSFPSLWTGTEMIVWAGSGPGVLNSGARYNPATDSWMTMTTVGAPPSVTRFQHAAAWTGSQMVAWGGWNGGAPNGTGGCYDPATDTWTLLPTTGAPPARHSHLMAWDGNEVLIWGGRTSSGNASSVVPDVWCFRKCP